MWALNGQVKANLSFILWLMMRLLNAVRRLASVVPNTRQDADMIGEPQEQNVGHTNRLSCHL